MLNNSEVAELISYLKHTTWGKDDIELMQKRASDITLYNIKQLIEYIGFLEYSYNKYFEIINKAHLYNDHLKEHAKYHLNLGHLRKMEKILEGD